jgi:hypothetical protein
MDMVRIHGSVLRIASVLFNSSQKGMPKKQTARRVIHELLRPGIKRMANVANADQDARTDRPRLDHVAAGAADFGIHIFRMNVSFHKKGEQPTNRPPLDKREFGRAERGNYGAQVSTAESFYNPSLGS